jgi:HAD superfamily hydrolase (TIGR01484 family)
MKLFATDYDGTLYLDDKQIKKTVKKLKKLKNNGFIIAIVTGRGYPSIKNQSIIHNIPYDYIACSDGSVIYNNEGIIEKKYLINKEMIKPFEDFYKPINFEEIQYSYPTGYSNILKEDDDDLIGLNVCVSNENYTVELVDSFMKMSKNYPEYSFLNYMHPNFSFLCIKPKGISKSAAVEEIRRKNKIKKEDVYTIGDSANDYEMIRDFKGVCVTNSVQELFTVATKTYKSIDNYIDDILKED